jgi:hypothetical protein
VAERVAVTSTLSILSESGSAAMATPADKAATASKVRLLIYTLLMFSQK